jgi:uncharacterized membrane protein YhaH (DUF805 family)
MNGRKKDARKKQWWWLIQVQPLISRAFATFVNRRAVHMNWSYVRMCLGCVAGETCSHFSFVMKGDITHFNERTVSWLTYS